ncbi:MAG: imidazole glycerol phosphate synthase subunit HisF [Symbiobacteriia bacterium]
MAGSGLARRIIPCLDVKDGRVVKGVRFEGLRDAGDPVALARLYDQAGADELVFYDISAAAEGRSTMIDVVARTAAEAFIPLTVGGGIGSVGDIRDLLRAGADKVSINSQAVADPGLLARGAERFGAQCIVLGVDARRVFEGGRWTGRWEVVTHGGRRPAGLDLLEWVTLAERLGAGEIVLNSIDADGTQGGYDLAATRAVADAVRVPVVASGGAGKLDDFCQALTVGGADAALAASLFHYGTLTIAAVKEYLAAQGVPVRLPQEGMQDD